MMFLISRFHALALALGLGALSGCVSMASVQDFPRSATEIRFDEIAKQGLRQDGAWNLETQYEYYFEVDAALIDQLHGAIESAMTRLDYRVVRSDKAQRVVLGERSITMAEWNSVTGVYYSVKGDVVQVYVKNAITQDITGGWRDNRAKALSDKLCTEMLRCKVRISLADDRAAKPSK
jgi:hypothetical protein